MKDYCHHTVFMCMWSCVIQGVLTTPWLPVGDSTLMVVVSTWVAVGNITLMGVDLTWLVGGNMSLMVDISA